jgi:hypothetical protein
VSRNFEFKSWGERGENDEQSTSMNHVVSSHMSYWPVFLTPPLSSKNMFTQWSGSKLHIGVGRQSWNCTRKSTAHLYSLRCTYFLEISVAKESKVVWKIAWVPLTE